MRDNADTRDRDNQFISVKVLITPDRVRTFMYFGYSNRRTIKHRERASPRHRPPRMRRNVTLVALPKEPKRTAKSRRCLGQRLINRWLGTAEQRLTDADAAAS